jgi:hypothetical protein
VKPPAGPRPVEVLTEYFSILSIVLMLVIVLVLERLSYACALSRTGIG